MTKRADLSAHDLIRWIGLIAGPLLAGVVFLLIPAAETPEAAAAHHALTLPGRATAALMVWMAIWWLTAPIDLAVTALLPLVVLPLAGLDGASAQSQFAIAASPYADPFIVFFLGGFMLSLAMERWRLHRRIALVALRLVGARPTAIVAGFMAISAVMSMWVSNTATTVMMLPVALSVIQLADRDGSASADPRRANFPTCLLLCLAYAASIGGVGTIIGTPPNLILAGFLQTQYGITVSFVRWLAVGLPLVVVFTPLAWLLMTRVIYPLAREPIAGGHALIVEEHRKLGKPSRGELAVFIIFMLTALSWIMRPLLQRIAIAGVQPLANLTDAGIAVIATVALFVVPVSIKSRTFVLDWDTAKRLPWGILILFGGGLSLGAAVKQNGVADLIGVQAAQLAGLPGLMVVVIVTATVFLLTQLTSNTATTATLLPILAGMAPALGIHPVLLLIPATVAASCAFMMPVATPPNAIILSSGQVTVAQMCRAGAWLTVIGLILIVGFAYAIALPLFGALF